MRPPIIPRIFLQQAAIALEEVLQRNDQKPDWVPGMGEAVTVEHSRGLLALLDEELRELKETIVPGGDVTRVQAEALDVAACALFIWHAAMGSGSRDRGRRA